MVNPRERIAEYTKRGLSVERGFEKAGKVFERHAHEMTILATHSGSLVLTVYDEDPPRIEHLLPGSEFTVGTGVEHSAVVGETGWGYVAAFDPEEAKKYEGEGAR